MSELLTKVELANRLKRSEWYITSMKRAGFEMPGGTATLEEAREWLRSNPGFSSSKAMKSPRVKPLKNVKLRTL
jgi:hypothetical protein